MDKVFKISVFGLKPNEQNTLSSIFKLAASRNNKYAIVSATERETADIILVDADDANAMNEWKNFSVHHQKTPVVKVTKKVPATVNEGEVYLRRPLILKRVLDTLDPVAIKTGGIIIGGDVIIDIPSPLPSDDTTSDNGVKVLVVDDALAIRKAMDINLRRFRVNIDLAETGEEALEYTEKNIYDIIFLDVMLPGIDGYQVCKKIKSHKTAKNTPVIMLTGKDGSIDKLRGKMAGANLWLIKPVEPDELKKVLEQYLPGIVGG